VPLFAELKILIDMNLNRVELGISPNGRLRHATETGASSSVAPMAAAK
jgi:hypothetical protein